MKKLNLLLPALHCLSGTFCIAQPVNYWQQQVNYQINVTLNTSFHTLQGDIEIEYINNSPQILTNIYMHLWPNGYKNRETAFAKQQLENGKTDFYFAGNAERGYIDSLEFSVNGKAINWQYANIDGKLNYDIALLQLPSPLYPNQKVTIKTPFFVKLPKVFSRLGHEAGIYCITQWYPKPAVFDKTGWHPMPYLDQGEFYSEFGDFRVNITVPANMRVAATGILQNQDEFNWLVDLAGGKKLNNPSQTDTKILTYYQANVHDFAWFASEDFNVLYDTTRLSNGKEIQTWLFGKNINNNGIKYTKSGLKFYSDRVGEYPYDICTVVITPLQAGGGMEYPTITNCGSLDEQTIVHEVGHNWFYGILGSNERNYPWLDESINTFYENWHNDVVHKKNESTAYASAGAFGFNINLDLKGINGSITTYMYSGRQRADQPGNLRATDYTDINYGTVVYAKNPLALFYLKSYLGDSVFTGMMRSYYAQWKFKHPQPEDLINHCVAYTGDTTVIDFFTSALADGRYDIVFKKKKNKLFVSNKLNGKGPIPVSLVIGDSLVNTTWIKNSTIDFIDLNLYRNLSKDARLTVYQENLPLELYPQNNQLQLKNNSTVAPLKLNFLFQKESATRTNVFFAPVYGYNLYNKHMAGIAFYNSIFPQKRNEFVLLPMYSFNTNDVNGYAQYWHNFYPSGRIQRIQLGFNFARFATNGLVTNSLNAEIQNNINQFGALYAGTSYEKFAPFITLHIKPKNLRSKIVQQLQARYVNINEYERNANYFNTLNKPIGIAEVSYLYNNPNVLFPSQFGAAFQKGLSTTTISRLGADFTQHVLYKDGKKTASIRFFGGTFLSPNTPSGNTIGGNYYERAMFQGAGTTGINDYLYDYAMIGRTENNPQANLWGRQAILRDAGFRSFVNIGSTDKMIFATNLTVPFPISLPIGFYADASYANLKSITNGNVVSYTNTLSYMAGFYISINKDIIGWYIPLFQSSNIDNALNMTGLSNVFERSSIIINLNRLNPIKAVRNINL
jgi:hypothetical protein